MHKNYLGEKNDLKDALAKTEKSAKMFKMISIGAGVAFLGALAWALLKK